MSVVSDNPADIPIEAVEAAAKVQVSATTPAVTLLSDFLSRLKAGKLNQLIKLPGALHGIEIGAGLIAVIGSPPGFGKTALSMQVVFQALELDENLRVVIANAETDFDGLLRRELTRLTRIDSDAIRFGKLTDSDHARIIDASAGLAKPLERVEVLNDPHNLQQLMRLADGAPGLLVVDYLQKFTPVGMEAKQGITAFMGGMRLLAKRGWAVVALSATSRTQGKNGSAHDSSKLTQASYRDSGEIEFNADACYMLVDKGAHEEKEYIRRVDLVCVKNRHAKKKDFELIFNMPAMSFDEAGPTPNPDFAGFAGSNPFKSEDDF